ncbi:hypothetical protein [Rhodanobacter sp. FW106-PBR-LB-2-11]|uniref:hypothetical protein n=1 Tax=Rhodanobacter sp. FW106-PBR-LB-2-11 TaxID=1524463 RepID=UPI0034E46374
MSTVSHNYIAQSYTRNLGKGILTSGWRVMHGDAVVCDCYGGEHRAASIAEYLNATTAPDAPPAVSRTSPRLPQLDAEAQAVLIGTLRLIDKQLSGAGTPSQAAVAMIRREIRCAIVDHASGREGICDQLAVTAYRRAFPG